MKKIIPLLIILMTTVQMSAQTMKDIITTMPDSITPLLTTNNKLDFIDYIGAGQKAVEKNKLGRDTEMTKLTDTHAFIQMSSQTSMDIKLLKKDTPQIGIITTVQSDSTTFASIIKYYTLDWKLLNTVLPTDFVKYEWNDDDEELKATKYEPLTIKSDKFEK